MNKQSENAHINESDGWKIAAFFFIPSKNQTKITVRSFFQSLRLGNSLKFHNVRGAAVLSMVYIMNEEDSLSPYLPLLQFPEAFFPISNLNLTKNV